MVSVQRYRETKLFPEWNRWKKYSFSIPGSSCELKDKLFSVDAEILAKAAGIVRKDMFLHKGLNFS